MSGLSQKEVDALLAAVVDENAGEGGALDRSQSEPSGSNVSVIQKNVQNYDLTSRDRVVRGRFPQLDVIHEKFMRSFRVSLSNALGQVAVISVASTDFLKFGEFINTLPLPTCMNVLRFQNLRGSGLFVIESKLVNALVHLFFGGSKRSYARVEQKDFTAIQLSIIRKVVQLAINDLEASWESIEKIGASFVRTESNPQFVGIVPPTDIVIVTTFDVELEVIHGTITIVIPYSAIEPIKQKLSSVFQIESDQAEKKIWSHIIQQQLLDAQVEIKVELGESYLQLEEVMNLKVGDVIPLNQDASGELMIQVEDVPLFKGFYGTRHGSVATKITNVLAK